MHNIWLLQCDGLVNVDALSRCTPKAFVTRLFCRRHCLESFARHSVAATRLFRRRHPVPATRLSRRSVVCMLSGSCYAKIISTLKRSGLCTSSGFRYATVLSTSRPRVVCTPKAFCHHYHSVTTLSDSRPRKDFLDVEA